MLSLRITCMAGFTALWLGGCASPSAPYGTGAPGSAAPTSGGMSVGIPPDTGIAPGTRGHVITREGPVTGREGDLSPEEAARQQATQYCANLSQSLRIVDVRRARMPSAGGWERVQMTFICERASP